MKKILFCLSICVCAFANNYKIIPIEKIEYDKDLAQIGKRMYFDTSISPHKLSCNTCHDLDITGSGTNKSGINTDGRMNPPTTLNIAHANLFFQDATATNLIEQVAESFGKDMAISSEHLMNTFKNSKEYQDLFKKAGIKPSYENAIRALAEFEKALVTLDAPFDLYLKGDDNAIGVKAKIGLELFKYYGCAVCHNGMNLGANMVAPISTIFSPYCDNYNQDMIKVPTLRNITITAPYSYNGGFLNLQDIVKDMAFCQVGIYLSDEETENIVEFLKTLEGKRPEILDEK